MIYYLFIKTTDNKMVDSASFSSRAEAELFVEMLLDNMAEFNIMADAFGFENKFDIESLEFEIVGVKGV